MPRSCEAGRRPDGGHPPPRPDHGTRTRAHRTQRQKQHQSHALGRLRRWRGGGGVQSGTTQTAVGRSTRVGAIRRQGRVPPERRVRARTSQRHHRGCRKRSGKRRWTPVTHEKRVHRCLPLQPPATPPHHALPRPALPRLALPCASLPCYAMPLPRRPPATAFRGLASAVQPTVVGGC